MKHQIQDGSNYDRLIPKTKNEKTNLATGSTDVGLKEMRSWTQKYQYQVKSLASVLKGASISQTVSNIHSFLYNHIQYLADGALQNLRSPANSWQNRDTGIDCKSYSIFAVALLNELGITAYFRKIKQPFFKPNQWTHVYVIVPKDQKTSSASNYYVLDATLLINVEVPYNEKKDLLMETNLKYQGLNGVAVAPQVTNEVIANFYVFLQQLLDDGYPQAGVLTLKNRVETILKTGVEPTFKFKDNGVFVNDNFIYLPKPQGLNGTPATVTALPTFKNIGVDSSYRASNSLNIGTINKGSGGFNFTNGIDIGSINPSKPLLQTGTTLALSAAGVPFASQIVGTLSSIFSSFGHSAANPTSQAQIIAENIKIADTILASMNANNIDSVLNEISRFLAYQIYSYQHSLTRRKWAPKTEEAWKMHVAAFQSYNQQKFLPILSSIQSNGYKINTATQTVSEQSLEDIYRPDVAKNNTTAEDNDAAVGKITFTTYQVIVPANAGNNPLSNNSNSTPSTASFGVIGAILLGALALGNMKKSSEN